MAKLGPGSVSPAPRLVVFLLCRVALASVGVTGHREEKEEADADTVTVRTASLGSLPPWPPGLLCRQVYRETLGPPLSRVVLGVRPVSFRASERPLCPATVLALQVCPLPLWPWSGLRELPHQAWTGCWSSVLRAALEGSMKRHQCVGKGSGLGNSRKGGFRTCRVLSPHFLQYEGPEGNLQDTSPNSAGLLLSCRLFPTLGYGIILVLSSFSWFSFISPEP